MTVIRHQKRANASAQKNELFKQPILVVDGQKPLAQLLAHKIQDRWDCEVHTASSLQQVKDELESQPKGFLIAACDYKLPDAPHGEVIETLSAAGIPTIAMTGAFDVEMREAILEKGAIDYVLKNSNNAYEYISELVGRLAKNARIKILAVDDSRSAREVIERYLRILCFNVYSAADGEKALQVLEQHPDIRLLLTDYNMPVMDGFELIARVRKRLGKDHLVIIGISASEIGNLSAQFLKAGANDFLAKPFSYEEFFCRIHQNLDMLEMIEANRDAANHDYLTGLYNRRYFFLNGCKIYGEARRSGSKIVVAMVDIDFFKKVNDKYGHDNGDIALKHVSAMLREHLGHGLIARLGGEEFAVLLIDVSLDEAFRQLEELRRAIEALPVRNGDTTIPLTVSIGMCEQPGKSLDDILRAADLKLYQAKEGGRNKVVC